MANSLQWGAPACAPVNRGCLHVRLSMSFHTPRFPAVQQKSQKNQQKKAFFDISQFGLTSGKKVL